MRLRRKGDLFERGVFSGRFELHPFFVEPDARDMILARRPTRTRAASLKFPDELREHPLREVRSTGQPGPGQQPQASAGRGNSPVRCFPTRSKAG